MSITSDLRAYADSAVNQGKQTLSAASAQLSGVGGQASELVNKFAGTARVSDIADRANDAVTDLRASAEKLINVDAVRTAVEPYLEQLRAYGDSVGDRVDEVVSSLKDDPRFGRLLETADSFSALVVELVQERVVKPVQSLTRSDAKPARKPSPKPTSKATKPAAARPAAKRPAAKTTARKAPAKRTGSSA